MAKKKKNNAPVLSRRGREKMRGVCRQFDWIMLVYIALVVIAVTIGRLEPYELGKPSISGFAVWFLMLPAYLPLLLLGAADAVFGFDLNFAGREALLYGICDTVLAAAVWGWVRLYGVRRGIAFVRSAKLFVLIFVYWGIFQLGCSAAVWLWRSGDFAPLHVHFTSGNTE